MRANVQDVRASYAATSRPVALHVTSRRVVLRRYLAPRDDRQPLRRTRESDQLVGQ